MLSQVKSIGAKTETTQNTAVSLAATDFIPAYDVDVSPDIELNERNYVSTSLDTFSHIPGKKFQNVKFRTDLKGSGSATVPIPPLSALLQACGLVETIAANTSYAPTSAPASANFTGAGKSVTVKSYEGAAANGLLKVLAGCLFNPKFILEVGKPPQVEWNGKGIFAAVTDAATPTLTMNTDDPLVVQSATFSTSTYAAIISKLEIDFGNEISPHDSVAAASGISGFQITDRKPSGSCDPEAVLVATHDFYGISAAGTLGSLSIVIGTGTGKVFTITCPKTQYGKIGQADRNKIMTLNVPLLFHRNSGDDWISIVIT